MVVALGGNEILQPDQKGIKTEQLKNLQSTCKYIAEIIKSDQYRVVITHGNRPQVGNILLQNEAAKDRAEQMPMDVCGTES